MPGAIAHMVAVRQAQKRFIQEHGLTLVAECTAFQSAWLQAGSVAPDFSTRVLGSDQAKCLLYNVKWLN